MSHRNKTADPKRALMAVGIETPKSPTDSITVARRLQGGVAIVALLILALPQPGPCSPAFLEYTFDLDPSNVTITHDDDTGYDRIQYAGEQLAVIPGWEGAPLLPGLHRIILLPPGERVELLDVSVSQRVQIEGEFLPEPTPSEFDGDSEPDEFFYEYGGTYPEDRDIFLANNAYREIRYANVVALPFEWDGETHDLFLYKRVTVRLDLEAVPRGEGPPPRLRPERKYSRREFELDWAKRHAFNRDDLETFYTRPRGDLVFGNSVTEEQFGVGFQPTDRPSLEGSAVDMIILTDNQWAWGDSVSKGMEVPFQRLADWRTQTGTPSVVRTLSWVRDNYDGVDDPERIRSFLKEAYSLWGADYVIVGGDEEVIPSRRVTHFGGFRNDYPTIWYYASFDSVWNIDGDGFYEEAEDEDDYEHVLDEAPELWIGRIPVRDSLEAEQFVDKLQTCERVPGQGYSVPGDDYYTKTLLVAGLTNSSEWPEPGEDEYGNGIWYAEKLLEAVLDSVDAGIAASRLYPYLGLTEDCEGENVECYGDIKEQFATYPPGDAFSAATFRDSLDDAGASILFHIEHSNPHSLGGPSQGSSILPPIAYCEENSNCESCSQWQSDCWEEYKLKNQVKGLDRELAETLENGPNYLIAYTVGSLTGRYERMAIDEVLMRNPNGGVVAICGKNNSFNPNPAQAVPFFNSILRDDMPMSVALYDVTSTGNWQAPLVWHFFGDPTMEVWSDVPGDLDLTVDPDSLDRPGMTSITVTVKSGGSPVSDARVTLHHDTRNEDVYAFTNTDTDGEARFPSVLVMSGGNIDVRVVAHNYTPAETLLYVPTSFTTSPPNRPLHYVEHTYTDSDGPTTDVLEAGDSVALTVRLKNLATASADSSSPGLAHFAPTPRVKASMTIEGVHEDDKIFIGNKEANPPAGRDTFHVLMNEYGLRPEGQPLTTSTGEFHIWRDDDWLYHLKAHYDDQGADNGKSFKGIFTAEGGIDTVSTTIETADTVTVSANSVFFSFDGDTDDDEFIFDARAQDWITVSDDTASYGKVPGQGEAVCEFAFEIEAAMPGRENFGFSIRAEPDVGLTDHYSDFYLDIGAPEITLIELRTAQETSCIACEQSQLPYRTSITLRNSGTAAADMRIEFDGSLDEQVCRDTLEFTIPAGQEMTPANGFEFCDVSNYTMRLDTLRILRSFPSEYDTVLSVDDIALEPTIIKPSDVQVDATEGGFRVVWDAVSSGSQGAIFGYHAFKRVDGTTARLTDAPLTSSTQTWLRDLDYYDGGGDEIDYELGIAVVDTNYTMGPIVWSASDDERPNLPVTEPWPLKATRGPVYSITLVDLDGDDDLEILAGGQVISAWHHDGTPVISQSDGLLFDPIDSNSEFDQPFLRFFDLAAADIDNDGDVEIAGCYGNDTLYVVDENGDRKWAKEVIAKSAPTLADIDNDGYHEVIVNAYLDGKLYVFNHDGTSFRPCDVDSGLFARNVASSNPDTDADYNWSGVAVADLDGDNELEIIQPMRSGYVYAWEPDDNDQCPNTNPDSLWRGELLTPPATRNVGTPAVAHLIGDATQDVVVSTTAHYKVQILDGDDGLRLDGELAVWDTTLLTLPLKEEIQAPAIANLGGSLDYEILLGTQVDSTQLYSPITKLAVLYLDNDDDPLISTAVDSIRVPGRRSSLTSTVGQPLVADIDDDSYKEVLIGSDDGGLFCWEVRWNAIESRFDTEPEKGWPIVFPETPAIFAVDDIDDDAFTELIVAAGQYVYVYELAGTSAPWGQAGHDARRTGNVNGGGSGQPLMPGDPSDDLKGGMFVMGPNPFNPTVTLSFQVPGRTNVSAKVYDVAGRLVRTLRNDEALPGGVYNDVWDGRADNGKSLGSGVYFVRTVIGGREFTRKLILAK